MAYVYYRTITIDQSLCGSSDSTNYPFLFEGTFSWLATVANGGRIENSSGFDIIFATDNLGAFPLKFELDKYDPVTGDVAFWVKIPTLSTTVNTVIYIVYSDSSITTFQGDVVNTWNSDFNCVFHFPSTGSTVSAGTVTDSSGHGNDLNAVTGSPTLVAGKIGQAFQGSSSASANRSHVTGTSLPTGTGPCSVETWYKSANASQTAVIGGFGDNAPGASRFNILLTSTLLSINCRDTSVDISVTQDTNWHHVVIIYPSGATKLGDSLVYLDNSLLTTPANATPLASSGAPDLAVGTISGAPGVLNFDGLIDEFRIYQVGLSASWIEADYNNQNDPATFFAVGSEGSTGLTTSIGVTQALIEVAQHGEQGADPPALFITQAAIEVASRGDVELNITQAVIEVAMYPDSALVVTQALIEVASVGNGPRRMVKAKYTKTLRSH